MVIPTNSSVEGMYIKEKLKEFTYVENFGIFLRLLSFLTYRHLGIGNTIPLKAGDKVMLIQTPKGIYLRMGEKIIKIKLPASLLSSLVSPSNDLEDIIPQMAKKGQSITMVS